MIIPFIALFLPAVTLGETKSIYKIAHVLSRVSNMIHKRKGQKKKKRNKEYNQTTSAFYIRWDATV